MNFNVSRISLLPLITKSVTKQRIPTLYGRFKIQLLVINPFTPGNVACRKTLLKLVERFSSNCRAVKSKNLP